MRGYPDERGRLLGWGTQTGFSNRISRHVVKQVANKSSLTTEDADVAAMYQIGIRSKQENLFHEDITATVCFTNKEPSSDSPPRLTDSHLYNSVPVPPLSIGSILILSLQELYCQ